MELVAEKYKQTEIGLIPENWELKAIGDIFTFYSTSNYSKAEMTLDGEVGCVHYGLIHAMDNTSFSLKNGVKYYVAKEQAKYETLQNGDVVMVDASEDLVGLNKSVEVSGIIDKEYIAGLHTFHLRDKNAIYIDSLRGLILNSEAVKKQMLRVAVGMKVFGVSKLQLQQIFVPVPTKAEQTAIATALSDADALISSLEKLIAKKRNIKQGAMQKLFSTGNLQELRLDEIVVIKKGEQLNKSDMSDKGTYPALNGGIEPSGYTDKWNTEKDVITISEGGNSCGFVNFSTERFWLGGHCYAIELIDAKFPKIYLYQYLKFSQKQIMELRVGSGLPNIQKTALNNFKMKINKSHDEKIKVANCLNDMDAEINVLGTKLEKYKKVKLGMMQNLLTGKIRLV